MHSLIRHLIALPVALGLLSACAAEVGSPGEAPEITPTLEDLPNAPIDVPAAPPVLPEPIVGPVPDLPNRPGTPPSDPGPPGPGDDPIPGEEEEGPVVTPRPRPAPFRVAAYYLREGSANPMTRPKAIDFSDVDDVMFAFISHRDGQCDLTGGEADEALIAELGAVIPEEARMHLSLRLWDEDGNIPLPSDGASMTRLAESCASLVEKYGADGLDVAFPEVAGAAITGAEGDLVSEFVVALRVAMSPEHRLSIAPPAGPAADAVMTPELLAHVEAVHAIAYDLGSDDEVMTRPFAPTYDLEGAEDEMSTADALVHMANAGVPGGMTLLGVSFQGRGFDGVEDATSDGLYAPAASSMRGSAGTAGLSHDDFEAFPGAHHVDPASGAEWRYDAAGGSLATAETPRTLAAKRDLAQDSGLAGMVVYDIAADSADGRLMRAVR